MFKKENYKEMLCPICKNFYFSPLQNDKIEDGGYFSKLVEKFAVKNEIPQCHRCGWKYDLDQLENPNLKQGENELSFWEYKKWYSEKLQENPQFHYLESQYTPEPHKCPICNKYEFDDINSHDVCPFCGWEDDGLMEDEPDSWAGCANDLCLNDYKKRYEKLAAEIPLYSYDKHEYGKNNPK